MTRVLAALLGAKQPTFRLSLNQLERSGGLPGVDIRLTTDILHRTQAKLRQLGLDPRDTTQKELYHALQERLARDDTAVLAALGLAKDATVAEILQTVQAFTTRVTPDKSLVLKASTAKVLLKKHVPTKTMKLLGYRSDISMLKHEPISHIYAAAHIAESEAWWQEFRASYTSLKPGDFEMKRIAIIAPSTDRWRAVGAEHAAEKRHNIVALNELGSVILLPIEESHSIRGLALVMLLLTLQSINDIRSSSSYLKFQQVKPHFGETVALVSQNRVYAAAELANQPVAWQALHRYYARNLDKYPTDIFEPHLQSDDLTWNAPEKTLLELDATLEFWHDTQYCGLTDDAGNAVSLNIFDAVLNYCNNLPFSARVSEYIKQSVWYELTSRYLEQNSVEKLIREQLTVDPNLAIEN